MAATAWLDVNPVAHRLQVELAHRERAVVRPLAQDVLDALDIAAFPAQQLDDGVREVLVGEETETPRHSAA